MKSESRHNYLTKAQEKKVLGLGPKFRFQPWLPSTFLNWSLIHNYNFFQGSQYTLISWLNNYLLTLMSFFVISQCCKNNQFTFWASI
jgi:hypothetical protein